MYFPIKTIIFIALLTGCIILQIYLSRMESRWPGLILPIIVFIISFMVPLNMMVPPEGVTSGLILQLVLVWLLANIPTLILLGIYFVCRDKYRRRKQLDKMIINDLD